MKDIYKKRLLKLAKHLRSGKLGHKKFRFDLLNANRFGQEMQTNGCGTLGCAIGECPFVFPKDWKFLNGGVVLVGTKKNRIWLGLEQAQRFFGITEIERRHLFHPRSQHTSEYGGRKLGYRARPKSVARNIEIFVARKETTKLKHAGVTPGDWIIKGAAGLTSSPTLTRKSYDGKNNKANRKGQRCRRPKGCN